MAGSNIIMLLTVARGLEELNERVVYVGGSVAELYATDPAATEVRPTIDIDCVIELATYSKLSELETILRKKGFHNDLTPNAPICRWLYNGIVVDIMPDDENVMGFTNRWYKSGMKHKVQKALTDDITVSIFPVEYYLATKMEAVHGRGGGDLRQSHDFEDIIYIMNSCNELKMTIGGSSDQELKKYVGQNCKYFLNDPNIMEVIECALPYGEEERAVLIYELMSDLSC